MSQGSIQIPTQGPVTPSSYSGLINTAFGAFATKNSGGSAPTNFSTGTGTPQSFQDWVNTGTATNSPWQVYDGTNWLVIGTVDTSNHIWKTYFAAGAAVTQQTYSVNQNNLNPFSTLAENRVPIVSTSSTGVQITGITSTVVGMGDGRIVTLEIADASVASYQLLAASAASSAGNRFDMPTNLYAASGHTISFYYSSTAANWRHLCGGMRAPTQQKFTSGTAATYTTPTGAVRLRVRMVGGGASGAQSSTGGTDGTAGNATSFGGVSANGGAAPTHLGVGGALSGNGAGTLGTWTNRFQGSAGDYGSTIATGGNGGNSFFDGGGPPGGAAAANSGSGGGGVSSTSTAAGGGGGAGEYVEMDVPGPSTAYTYTVGSSASAPTGAGGGAAGQILVEEFYQ
jgi:hypothetical protein